MRVGFTGTRRETGMIRRGNRITIDVEAALASDRERRTQMNETQRQTSERHKALFHKGSQFDDRLFTAPQSGEERQTWMVKMITAMVLEPGVWFERVYPIEGKDAVKERIAKDQASTFNAAGKKIKSEPKDGDNSAIKYLRKHGGHFEAQYTSNPVETKDGKVVILRVRYYPPKSDEGQFS